MLIGADDHTTTDNEPELLIEEARERQRRRVRRQTAVLFALGGVVVLGLGAYRIARGGHAAPAPKPRATPVVAHQPLVIYEKVETVVSMPHRLTFRRTGEVWFSTTAPRTYRELVTVAGGPTLEVGAAPVHDPKLGNEIVDYLYDAKADAVYETGAGLMLPAPPPSPSPQRVFRHLLALRGMRLEGTRLFHGHKVYVVLDEPYVVVTGHVHKIYAGPPLLRLYVDTATYRVMFAATSVPGMDARVSMSLLAYRTLPATPANLALTSLAQAHPGAARVVAWPPPPRIHRLYDEASQIGKFVGVGLGPSGGFIPGTSL